MDPETADMVELFKQDLEPIINKHGLDKALGMADYVVADYITNTLAVLSSAIRYEWESQFSGRR